MKISYTTIEDARTALINSGMYELVNLEHEDSVVEFMWRNNATLKEALKHNTAWIKL